MEVRLDPIGVTLPSGDVWLFSDMELMVADKGTGHFLYQNKTNQGPGLTLIFDQGLKDPAKDYIGRISKALVDGSSWHFVRWQVITGATIIGLMVASYLAYPYLNRAIVALVPDSWAVKAGDLVLDELYTEYSSNVCHSEEGDKALAKMVDGLHMQGLPYALRVQVVDHGQVNALTAPGGRVVLLNGLIQKAESADEVAGVLAHEVGHVYYKHPMQGLVNVLGLSIVGSFFGGDAGSIAVVVLSLSYSRDAERQADDKALQILRDSNVSAQGFLDFFARLKKKEQDTVAAELQKLLSTHPLTEERMKYIADYIDTEKKSVPLLTEEEWQALKDICKPADKS